MMAHFSADDTKPVEIGDGIWWVGFLDSEAGLSNNPYLLVDGDEAVLFDPGPGHPVFRDMIVDKLYEVVPLDHIRYVVVHHQDPDLCGLIPLIESFLHPQVVILTPPKAALFVPYYGVRRPIVPVADGDALRLASGRTIRFIHIPYVHFAGNMASYDESSSTLFSSDVFGAFAREGSERSHAAAVKDFLEDYADSEVALRFAHERFSRLPIRRILPQHGTPITERVSEYVDILLQARPGRAIRQVPAPPTADQGSAAFAEVKQWFEAFTGTQVEAGAPEELLQEASSRGTSVLAQTLERFDSVCGSRGIANVAATGRIHGAETLAEAPNAALVETYRRRMLAREFRIRQSTDVETTAEIAGKGLVSVRTDLAVMFVDIREFSRWCTGRSADEIITMLSRHHEAVARVVRGHAGRINKVMGDGMLVYFRKGHAQNCLDAALAIHRQAGLLKLLPMGIGCSLGDAVIGDVGEESRIDFTVIGRAVNEASRLCAAAAPGELCVSANLLAAADAEAVSRLSASCVRSARAVPGKPHDQPIDAVCFRVMELRPR
jgi:class 3 adenylate cyclase